MKPKCSCTRAMGGEKHTELSAKHGIRHAWTCMTGSGTVSLVFIDKRAGCINCEVCRATLRWSSAKCWMQRASQSKWIMTQSDPRVSQVKEMGYSSMAKSLTWSQLNRACSFSYWRKTGTPINKQQLQVAAVKAQQTISREETHLVMLHVLRQNSLITQGSG